MIGTILEMLGHELDESTLKEIIDEIDQDGKCSVIVLLPLLRELFGTSALLKVQ